MIDKIRWAVDYSKEQLCTRIEALEAENARLQEQNDQLVFATELLVKELNALKETKQEDHPEITITP